VASEFWGKIPVAHWVGGLCSGLDSEKSYFKKAIISRFPGHKNHSLVTEC
jgi:hypothetical protein